MASAGCANVPSDTGWVLLPQESGVPILPGSWVLLALALCDGR